MIILLYITIFNRDIETDLILIPNLLFTHFEDFHEQIIVIILVLKWSKLLYKFLEMWTF